MWLVPTNASNLVDDLWVGPYLSRGVRVRVRGGPVVVGHHIPAEEVAATERAQSLVSRGYPATLETDEAVAVYEPPPVVDPAQTEEMRTRRVLVEQALLRGWTAEELEGVWDGTRHTDRGLRSRHTGLTLLEMTLSPPPEEWAALKADARAPWDSTTWTPPHRDWTAPAWHSPIPKHREPERQVVVIDDTNGEGRASEED